MAKTLSLTKVSTTEVEITIYRNISEQVDSRSQSLLKSKSDFHVFNYNPKSGAWEGTLMQTPGPNPVVGCFLFFVCPSLQATPNISSFNHGWAIYQPVGVVFYHSQPLFPRVRPE